jgi:hypothetical protein
MYIHIQAKYSVEEMFTEEAEEDEEEEEENDEGDYPLTYVYLCVLEQRYICIHICMYVCMYEFIHMYIYMYGGGRGR